MIIADELLESLTRDGDLISAEALLDAKQLAGRERISLYDAIVQMGLLSDQNLGQLVASSLGLPFVELVNTSIPKDILETIPEVVARKQLIIAFGKDADGLHVAMADPSNIEIVDFLKKKTGLPVVIHFSTQKDIEGAMALYAKDIGHMFDEIIRENIERAPATHAGKF